MEENKETNTKNTNVQNGIIKINPLITVQAKPLPTKLQHSSENKKKHDRNESE